MNNQLFEQVDNYISNFLAPQDDALISVIDNLKQSNIDNASISANQGKFLQVLGIICNARRILEIGTLGGYSTIWLARILPEDGKLISLECNSTHAKIAKENLQQAGLSEKVEIRLGAALDILPYLLNEE
nr:class I SAM-dependent methyltransferase [Bacteroidia bacterium]